MRADLLLQALSSNLEKEKEQISKDLRAVQQERDDLGKDQPVFLVMRALFEKPDNHTRRHQRRNQHNDLGKKLAYLFHGIKLGYTGQGQA